MKMSFFFEVDFFFKGGSADDLDLMAVVFFAINTLALFLKAGFLIRVIFSGERKMGV